MTTTKKLKPATTAATARFEELVQLAIRDQSITGAAFCAVDSEGQILINKAFGKTDIGEDAPDFTMNTPFWIASSTKLLTSIAALQQVEAGKLSLNDPIYNILPELKDYPILTGFDENDRPIVKAATKPMTLSHLMTHSSGIAYDLFDPLLKKYRQVMGLGASDRSRLLPDTFAKVILFEPGESWMYGAGLDWVGLAVERVTGVDLAEYMQKHIFEPLGMVEDTTFEPGDHPTIKNRLHGRIKRDSQRRGGPNKVAKFEDDHSFPNTGRAFSSGGGGLFSSTAEYIKVLQSILVKDDETLLKKETVQKYMVKGHLEEPARRAMQKSLTSPLWAPLGAVGLPWSEKERGLQWDHGLASALMMSDINGVCARGMMYWGGIPNNNWYIDVGTGVAGHHGTWILPHGDAFTGQLFGEFRKAMYEEVTSRGTDGHEGI